MPKRLNATPAVVNAFRRALPRWYCRHKRDLPWRGTRDPYRIWVSEIMLQQTRVEAVREYYRRWLRAFPTVRALARAPATRVLKLWEGLGYYTRARNLHKAAKQIRQMPRSFEEWYAFPGIGRYTAAAIASIAFDERVPVVDGNVARVLARVFAIRDNVKQPQTLDRMFARAQELMPATKAGDFNQAMMELGALVCAPVNPRCDACPLCRICLACKCGLVDQLPNRGKRPCIQQVTVTAAVVQRNGRVLVRRRPARGSLAGMWELPSGKGGKELFRLKYTIMNQRVTLRAVKGRTTARGRWITRRDLSRLSFPAGQRRALEKIFLTQQ